jgi:hypothetical protein
MIFDEADYGLDELLIKFGPNNASPRAVAALKFAEAVHFMSATYSDF